jgi:septum formation protein
MERERKIILASASPRRRELLARAGVLFEVVVPGVDEAPWPREKPASYALRNASEKARAVAARHPEAWILAADTIVVLDDQILEKPADVPHAAAMLRRLSGREHVVITGVCVRHPTPGGFREVADAVRTRVRFRALSDAEIDAYVATGEPLDKAGAYAIQGGAASFVERIDGPYDNVVGLPTDTVRRLLS